MPVDSDFTLRALGELIRIDSRNPDLEPGAPGEEALARAPRWTGLGSGLWRSPHEIDDSRPIVRTTLAAIEGVTGRPARTMAHPRRSIVSPGLGRSVPAISA
jgi:hypothetical protein